MKILESFHITCQTEVSMNMFQTSNVKYLSYAKTGQWNRSKWRKRSNVLIIFQSNIRSQWERYLFCLRKSLLKPKIWKGMAYFEFFQACRFKSCIIHASPKGSDEDIELGLLFFQCEFTLIYTLSRPYVYILGTK